MKTAYGIIWTKVSRVIFALFFIANPVAKHNKFIPIERILRYPCNKYRAVGHNPNIFVYTSKTPFNSQHINFAQLQILRLFWGLVHIQCGCIDSLYSSLTHITVEWNQYRIWCLNELFCTSRYCISKQKCLWTGRMILIVLPHGRW